MRVVAMKMREQQGLGNLAAKLRSALAHEEAAEFPNSVLLLAQRLVDLTDGLPKRIAVLDAQIANARQHSRFSARLQEMPGIWPITSNDHAD